MNTWYTRTTDIAPFSRAKDTDIDVPLASIEAAFDGLPDKHATKKGFGRPVVMADATAVDEGATAGQINKSSIFFGPDTGAANAHVVTLGITPAAYVAGLRVAFEAAATNAGAATVNVNGLGAKQLKDHDGTSLRPTAIVAGQYVEAVYVSGGYFQVVSDVRGITLSDVTTATAAAVTATEQVALAAAQVTLAEEQVALAEEQVALAEEQVALATEKADLTTLALSNANVTFATHFKYNF
jgi:hypothetical protein